MEMAEQHTAGLHVRPDRLIERIGEVFAASRPERGALRAAHRRRPAGWCLLTAPLCDDELPFGTIPDAIINEPLPPTERAGPVQRE